MNINNKIKNNSEGFTLLVAMIVTTLVLAIGFSIGNIILKELALSSSGKRSQIAFYAADSIAECALYWDRKDVSGNSVYNSDLGDSPFATSTPDNPFIQCGTGYGIQGSEPGQIANFEKTSDSLNATSSFVAVFGDSNDPTSISCGIVNIVKNLNKTTIYARGYNVGYLTGANGEGGNCDLSNPKTVERGIKVDY